MKDANKSFYINIKLELETSLKDVKVIQSQLLKFILMHWMMAFYDRLLQKILTHDELAFYTRNSW